MTNINKTIDINSLPTYSDEQIEELKKSGLVGTYEGTPVLIGNYEGIPVIDLPTYSDEQIDELKETGLVGTYNAIK